MKNYLFLLAFVQGSDSAGGENTKIKSQNDLLEQFWKESEHVFSVILNAPNGGNEEEIASKWGYTEVFFDNYTAEDSVSICVELSKKEMTNLPYEVKTIMVNI